MLDNPTFRDLIMLLLCSLIINRPILQSWGLELPKMVLMIVEKGQSRQLSDCLITRHTSQIDAYSKDTLLKKALTETNSAAVLYHFHQSATDSSFLETLIGVAESGCYSGEPIQALILTISEGFPLGISRETAFTICLDGDLHDLRSPDLTQFVPDDRNIPVVHELTKNFCGKLDNRDLAALTAAACFCYPQMSDDNRNDLFSRLLEAARQLVDLNDVLSEPEDIGDLVVNELLRWREATDFSQAYELPYLDKEACSHLETSVLFDNDYVYMSEHLFKDAMSRLLKAYPIMEILESLKTNGFLICSSARTATTRVSFYGPDGNYHRTRMLRFMRNKLTRLGDQPFVEACLSAKGDIEYES